MKNNKYKFRHLFSIIILLLLNSLFLGAQNEAYIVTSQNEKLSVEQFESSIDILKKRFKCQGIKLQHKYLSKEMKQFHFESSSTKDEEVIQNLIEKKGVLTLFGSTPDKQLSAALNNDPTLHKLSTGTESYSLKNANRGAGELFYAGAKDTALVKNRISEIAEINNWTSLKLAWSFKADENALFCLYLLNESGKMEGDLIKSAKVEKDNFSNGAFAIRFKFNKEAEQNWEQMTTEYLNQRVCLLIDGKVYFAPFVKSVISSGDAMITGDFSESEAKLLKCILGNSLSHTLKWEQ